MHSNGTVTLTGNDVIVLGRGGISLRVNADIGGFSAAGQAVLNGGSARMVHLADGNVAELAFANQLQNSTVGKNGAVLIAHNATGEQATLTLRVVRGSPTDEFLTDIVNEYIVKQSLFQVLTGSITKFLGTGQGGLRTDVYDLWAVVPQTVPGVISNVSGDTEQAVTVYTFSCLARKSIG